MAGRTRAERQILVALAKSKPEERTRYDLNKKTKLAYSVVFKSVERLIEKGLLRKGRKVPSEKGSEKQLYQLTFPGLVHALAFCEAGDVEEIARSNEKLWPNLPLILDSLKGWEKTVGEVLSGICRLYIEPFQPGFLKQGLSVLGVPVSEEFSPVPEESGKAKIPDATAFETFLLQLLLARVVLECGKDGDLTKFWGFLGLIKGNPVLRKSFHRTLLQQAENFAHASEGYRRLAEYLAPPSEEKKGPRKGEEVRRHESEPNRSNQP